jgi:hypothetical protein
MESLDQLATKLQDRADNKADAERGKAILDAGERIHLNELSDGDHILGDGVVQDLVREPVGRVRFNVRMDHDLLVKFDGHAEAWISIRGRGVSTPSSSSPVP